MSAHQLHYISSLSLTSLTALGLAIFVFLHPRKEPLHRVFVFYCLAIAGWAVFQGSEVFIEDEQIALLCARLVFVAAILIPALFLHFVYYLVKRPWLRRLLFPNYAMCGVFMAMVPFPAFIPSVSVRPYFQGALMHGYFMDAGPLFTFHVVWFLSVVTFGMILLLQETRLATGSRRNQLMYLSFGSVLGYVGGLPNYLYSYDYPLSIINPYATYGVPIYIAMEAYAIVKHHLMDIRIVIQKSLVYSLLIAVITATYLVAVLVMEKWFQGFFGYQSLVATVLVAFLIAISFNPLRTGIQTLVDRWLFQATPAELAKQREQLLGEVRKTEQMKAVATLAAGLAHEIKNPLTSLKTFTDYLPTKGAEPAFRQKFQQIASGEIERIHLIVQQLLDFAKPPPPRSSPRSTSRS